MSIPNFPPELVISIIFALFFGVGLHEYAHCKFADLAGDPTPSYYGRVTLNLTKHFEMSGVIMMVVSSLAGYGLGWGKAAPINGAKMRNPRSDLFIAVIAGPITNLLQAAVYAAVLRLLLAGGAHYDDPYYGNPDFLVRLCSIGVVTNLGLALFNLIPFGPLDGHWLVGLMMPEKPRYYWYRFNQNIGRMGLFAVVIVLQMTHISLIGGPLLRIYTALTGQPLFPA